MVLLRASHSWTVPIADFTYIETAEGSLYVAAVVDPFSGRRRLSEEVRDGDSVRYRQPHHGDLEKGSA
jgi:hypothetical protein